MDVREVFLASAGVARDAIADDAVGRAWDEPSVLDQQTVGGIAGHIARGGVWVVEDYLNAEIPDAPRAKSAAVDVARSASFLNADDHRLIRERGARVAAVGHRELSATLTRRLDELTPRLRAEPADRIVGAAGGVVVMTLDDYLETRIVEQVVHLDDLARSLGRDPWPVPPTALNLVLHIGIDIAQLRSDPTDVLRALYRSEPGPVFPVI